MTTSHRNPLAIRLRGALRRVRRAGESDHGAALVEFTLVIPVLLVVLMAILYVGSAINESIDETHLVNVAARYAAVNQDPGTGTLQSYIAAQGDTASLQVTDVCISFPVNPSTNTSGLVGDPVQVTMQSTYNWIPLLGLGTTTWVRTATMRLEAVPTNYSAICAH